MAAAIAAQTKADRPGQPTGADPVKPKPPPAHAASAAARRGARHRGSKYAALIIEADTGTVLFAKQAEERMPPASMSKIMTAYMVFTMLKEGRVTLGDELPVSEKAWKLGGSKMFVAVIEAKAPASRNGRNLIQGMLVESGNDACIVLAEGLAGSEQGFVELMNRKAAEIGLKDSHFANVTGLPDPNDWMTAQDLAALAIRTINDFPEYYHYFSEKDFVFNNIDQGNRNPLLYRNIGADGLKTGHTDEAGFSLTASVVRGDRRVILVVSGLPSMKSRATESERLIEWAFREFANYKLFTAGDKVDDAEVWLGTESKVGMTIGSSLTITLPRRSRRDMKVTAVYDGPLSRRPSSRATSSSSRSRVHNRGADMTPIERPLYAGAAVAPIGTLGRMATLAAYLIWGGRH